MRQVTPESVTQAVAVVCTVAMACALRGEYSRTLPPQPAPDRGIELSLVQEAPAPPAPKPEPIPPKPRAAPAQHRAVERALPVADVPAPSLADAPANPTGAVVMAPAPAAAAASHASVEDAYAAALRQIVEARTTVPATPEYRLLKPAGAAQIRFALDRAGSPSDVAVAHSSGSRILDRQALAIVASGRYPPFPDPAYAGESRHVFIVTIEFRT